MELPKNEYIPVERPISGELVYLDEMRHQEEFPSRFSELDDETRAMYEQMAKDYADLDIRLDILDDYEKFDSKLPGIDRSCIELADELLTHKHRENMPFVAICIDQAAKDVIDKLKQTRIGSLLCDDDEQLAFESEGGYYPVLDIKKKDAKLQGIGLTVHGLNSDRYTFTDSDEEIREPKRHLLMYPESEKINQREFILSFSYNIPNQKAGHFSEKIEFSVGESYTRISSSVYVSEYMEMGYEGHHARGLYDLEDADIAAMGSLIAEIVGDNPIATHERQTQQYEKYLTKIIRPESQRYIEEWVDNSWDGQVMADLEHKLKVGGLPLEKALVTPELVAEAHKVLADHVDYKRLSRNKYAAKGQDTVLGYEVEPWRDGEFRAK